MHVKQRKRALGEIFGRIDRTSIAVVELPQRVFRAANELRSEQEPLRAFDETCG